MRTRSLFLSLILLILPGVLRADDPPDRVARLGYFSGSVSFRPADLDEWAPASANYPLTEGDHLWTDDDGRGELRVGGSAVVRLAPRTAFSFLNLDDNTAQMRVSEGGVAVTIEDLDRDEVVEVDTPDAAVSFLERGFYRVEVTQDGTRTIVTVRRGQAEVSSGGASVIVHSGDAIVVDGGDSPRYDVRRAEGPTDWEDWALERDRRYEGGESRRYVSTGVVGYQDLDDHGRWRDDSEYGHVWVPTTVAVDWAPYRYGHWAFVQPWGWTWVDDAPWGFAPFHYGRWAHRPWGWCWVPGTMVARPVYAPALVAFVGGDDFAIKVGFGGGIGWFALGPREVYVPPYRTSPRYIQNVNVTNVNITNINVTNINVNNVNYVNRHVGGAVTVVNRETFVSSGNAARGAVKVSTLNMDRARVQPAAVEAFKPRRESILGASVASASIRKPPVQVQQRAVVTRFKPVAAPRTRAVVEGVRPAPAQPTLVKPAAQEGRGVKLRPAREGLPQAQVVRPGERPKVVGRQDEGPTTTKPSTARPTPIRPAPRPDQSERPKVSKPTPPPDRPTDREYDRQPPIRPTPRPDQSERPKVSKPTPPPDRPTDREYDRQPPIRPTPRPDQSERPKVSKPTPPPDPPTDREYDRQPPIRPTPRPDQSERPKVSKPTPPPDQPTDRKYDRQPPVRPTPRAQVDDPNKERPTDRENQAPPVKPSNRPSPNDRPATGKPSDRSQSNDSPGVSKSPTPERSPRGEPTPKAQESDKPKGKKGKPSPSPSPKGNR